MLYIRSSISFTTIYSPLLSQLDYSAPDVLWSHRKRPELFSLLLTGSGIVFFTGKVPTDSQVSRSRRGAQENTGIGVFVRPEGGEKRGMFLDVEFVNIIFASKTFEFVLPDMQRLSDLFQFSNRIILVSFFFYYLQVPTVWTVYNLLWLCSLFWR